METKGGRKIICFLLILLLTAGFFVLPKNVSADNVKNFIITEIMYSPEKNQGDWIEMYILDDAECNIKASDRQIIDFYLCTKKNSDGTCNQPWPVYATPDGCHFKKGEYLILTNQPDDFKSGEGITVLKLASAFNLLSNDDAFVAYSDDGKKNWQENIEYDKYDDFFGPKKPGYSLEKINTEKDNIESNWQRSYINGGTPGEKNSEKPEPKVYPSGIYINELLPNPAGSDEENEYIELYNSTANNIDLDGWILKDKSATGEYIFPKNSSIKEAGFSFIYSKDFSFSINNSDESIYLLNPNEEIVSSVSFSDSAKEDISYAYDTGNLAWRWTSKKTPGAKNEFDKVLSGKIERDDPIFVEIYASFAVEADSDAEKFTWDFGDNHKSYLKDTKHKYEKTGEYAGSLKISGNGEASEYFFTVKVEKYKAPKIRIKSISPNPKGLDTKEWIQIQNKSKNKIDLETWSIATGWDNLVNHPIREKFVIKPGKAKQLYHDICAFTLNNTKTKIELRDPSGKVVQKIKYDRTTNKIEEDEVYEKVDGGWGWSREQKSLFPTNADNTSPPLPSGEDVPLSGTGEGNNQNLEETSITLSDTEIQEGLGKFSEDPTWNAKKEYRLAILDREQKSLFPTTNIKTPPYLNNAGRVAGASIEKNIPSSQKHWAVELINNSWIKINSGMNRVLNTIL